jgi:hypothetical protein
MTPLGKKVAEAADGTLLFRCPGCGTFHNVNTGRRATGPRWNYNGDPDKPTFKPSVLVRTGHYVPGEAAAGWCEHSGGDDPCDCVVCHSFVTDGWIQFLRDCTHGLAGQMVELPDIRERETDE